MTRQGLIRSRKTLLGLLILLSLSLGACSYLGFESPSSVGSEHSAQGGSESRPSVGSKNKGSKAATKQKPVRDQNVNRSYCPDPQVAKLLVDHDFDTARFLLEEDLDRLSSTRAKRCVLLSFALLYALPESTYNNIEKAREYQFRAQNEGGLERAAMDVQLFNKSISSLLFTQERNELLSSDAEQLRLEIEKKEELIDRLKKLTLGDD